MFSNSEPITPADYTTEVQNAILEWKKKNPNKKCEPPIEEIISKLFNVIEIIEKVDNNEEQKKIQEWLDNHPTYPYNVIWSNCISYSNNAMDAGHSGEDELLQYIDWSCGIRR